MANAVPFNQMHPPSSMVLFTELCRELKVSERAQIKNLHNLLENLGLRSQRFPKPAAYKSPASYAVYVFRDEATRKLEDYIKKRQKMLGNVVPLEPAKSAKSPSKELTIKIREKLSRYYSRNFDVIRGRFSAGHSDERVAKWCSVSVEAAAEFRRRNFGPLTASNLKEEIKSLRNAIELLMKVLNALEKKVDQEGCDDSS